MLRTGPVILFASFAAICGTPKPLATDLPSAAAGVLSEANQARQAVLKQDQTAALDHVRNAKDLAEEMQAAMAGQPQPLLVPVTTHVETSTMYTNVRRHHNGQVSLKKNTNVSEVNENVTSGQLNVTTAADYLNAAEADVRNLDWNNAANNLSAATKLVNVDVSDANAPLLLARQNLLLARSRIQEGRSRAAVLPLRQAANALGQFEQERHGPLSQQAADMRASIDVYARQVRRNPDVSKINNWMDTISKWQERTRKPLHAALDH